MSFLAFRSPFRKSSLVSLVGGICLLLLLAYPIVHVHVYVIKKFVSVLETKATARRKIKDAQPEAQMPSK